MEHNVFMCLKLGIPLFSSYGGGCYEIITEVTSQK